MKKLTSFFFLLCSFQVFGHKAFGAEKEQLNFTACPVESSLESEYRVQLIVEVGREAVLMTIESNFPEMFPKPDLTFSITRTEHVSEKTRIIHTISEGKPMLMILSTDKRRYEMTVIDPNDPAPASLYSSEFCQR